MALSRFGRRWIKVSGVSVYCHTSPSGKRYVGISMYPEKRWANGNGYKKNFLFYRAIQKYGWENFTHEILYSNLSLDEANRIERALIEEWGLTNPMFGYNLRDEGNGGFGLDARRKMSESRIGNQNSLGNKLSCDTKRRISNALKSYYSSHQQSMLGKHHSTETIKKLRSREFSEETRKKMSLNHKNVSGVNNPSAKPIVQYTLDGCPIAYFMYAKAAADLYGLDLSTIIKCCKHKNKTCGGYKWEYATQF